MSSLILLLIPLFGYGTKTVKSGKLIEYLFPSKMIGSRNIEIWLPDNYNPQHKYDVVYMNDGQALFDASKNWNKKEWKVDSVADNLMAANKTRNFIVVGIDNDPNNRYYEYFPKKALEYIPTSDSLLLSCESKQFRSDDYLKFIITELKPFIDSNYSTNKDRSSTFIMGSSMGGLISLYALCEYPEIFEGAACLSMHTPMILIDNKEESIIWAKAFREYLDKMLPPLNSRYIYMDYGDQTLDSYYGPYQNEIDKMMISKKWESPYWETLFFPGSAHDENSWQKRLDIPLMFLLGIKR